MKIRARLYGLYNVTIVDFVTANSNDVKAVYVNYEGKVKSCYLADVQILDEDYVPTTR
jgi:hypothetical protein